MKSILKPAVILACLIVVPIVAGAMLYPLKSPLLSLWVVRIIVLYMLWWLIRQGQVSIRVAQDSQRRNDDMRAAMLTMLDGLNQSVVPMLEDLKEAVAGQERRQAVIAEGLEITRRELAEGIALKTELAARHVEHTLNVIQQKLDDNTDVTVRAAEAAEAAKQAGDVIVNARGELSQKIDAVLETAKQPGKKKDY